MNKKKKLLFLSLPLVLTALVSCSSPSHYEPISPNNETNTKDNGTGSTSDDPKDDVEYMSLDDYYFAYGISKNKIVDYFKSNGKKKSEYGYGDFYSISNDNLEVGYFPEQDQFISACKKTSRSYVSSIGVDYTYEYLGQVGINYYGSMTDIILSGKVDGTGVSRNTYQIVSADSGSWKYKTNVLETSFKLPSYTKVTTQVTTSSSFDVEYCKNAYNAVVAAWDYMIAVFKNIESKNIIDKYNSNDFLNINWNDVVFEDKTFKLDGKEHSIAPENIPDGVTVTYENNNKSEPGTYSVKAIFSDPKNVTLNEFSANLIIDDMFNVNVDYYLETTPRTSVTSKTYSVKYGSDISSILMADVTDEDGSKYVYSNSSSNFTDYKWDYSNINASIYVKAEHSGYVLVKSSINPNIDGKYLLLSSVFEHSNDIKVTKPEGEENSVSYYLSDIEYIKFSNETELPFFGGGHRLSYYGDYLTNLKEVDLSELKFITEIPGDFLCNCKNLTKVTGGKLKNLKTIGDYFLSYTNITTFDLDLSSVTKVGSYFMYHALEGDEARTISIDLSSVIRIKNWDSAGITQIQNGQTVTPSLLCQRTMGANSKLTLKMGDYLLTDAYFYDAHKVGEEWVYYGQYNLELYSNNKNTQQTLLTQLNGNVEIKQN